MNWMLWKSDGGDDWRSNSVNLRKKQQPLRLPQVAPEESLPQWSRACLSRFSVPVLRAPTIVECNRLR
ncbi:MAG: hypothetical protein SGILL_009228, partial [Bacillariaceae sp.]